jgi:hypothetical protein
MSGMRFDTAFYFLNALTLAFRIVNVIITDFSLDSVLTELARCLLLFPNLHTLQLLGDSWRMMRFSSRVFHGKIFPSVRTLVFSYRAYHVVACCPDVKQVTVVGNLNPDFLTASEVIFTQCVTNCPKVEVLRGFHRNSYGQFSRDLIQSRSQLSLYVEGS